MVQVNRIATYLDEDFADRVEATNGVATAIVVLVFAGFAFIVGLVIGLMV